MMSFRKWLALLVFYVLYLVVGAYTFLYLEGHEECDRFDRRRKNFDRSLQSFTTTSSISESDSKRLYAYLVKLCSVKGELNENSEIFNGLLLPKNGEHHIVCRNWDLYNSFIFTVTAATTIGYGQVAPVTFNGKLMCILYSLVGIPINGILIGSLGAYFASKLRSLHNDDDDDSDDDERRGSELKKLIHIIFDVILVLIPGIALFILAPAGLFSYVERWSYFDSIYYAYITLTTIGFGDYTAGRNNEALSKIGSYAIPYQIFIVVWIIFGLGYLFMIISIITDGLRVPVGKVVKKIEKSFIKKIIKQIVIMKQKDFEEYSQELTIEVQKEIVIPDSEKGGFEDIVEFEGALDNKEDPYEFNRDTIKSLQQFFEKNKKLNLSSLLYENGEAGYIRGRGGRRAVSMQHPPDMVVKNIENRMAENKRRTSAFFPEYMRRQRMGSVWKRNSTALSDFSFPDFIRTTTLEEFLAAARLVELNEADFSAKTNTKNEGNLSDPSAPQGTINDGLRKISTIASAGFEPIAKLFSGGSNQGKSNPIPLTNIDQSTINSSPVQSIISVYGKRD